VWHVSVSAWSRRTEERVSTPGICEKEAVRLLRGVGGDREWWWWNPAELIGHLRVAVTPAEYAVLPAPPGGLLDDAGESGPERPRTR
jgi:hypothetical protein